MSYYSFEHRSDISDMLGKTLVSVVQTHNNGDEIHFTTTDGDVYIMCHIQDCCESVTVEDVTGEVNDLIGSPLTMAESVSSSSGDKSTTKFSDDSFTWTFYKLATVKGYVTIRWYGTSNGYYSESVDVYKLGK